MNIKPTAHNVYVPRARRPQRPQFDSTRIRFHPYSINK